MVDVSFEKVLELADRLTPTEQTRLTAHLLKATHQRKLRADEKMSLLRAAQIDVEVIQEPSVYREDWYGEDGR